MLHYFVDIYIYSLEYVTFQKTFYLAPFSKGWSSVTEHVLASIRHRTNLQYQLTNQLIKQSNTKYNKMR